MPRYWKADTETMRPREVEAPGSWPAHDSEGSTVYENTHYATEADAWDSIRRNIEAEVHFAAEDVERARSALRLAEEKSAEAVVRMRRFLTARDEREKGNRG